MLDLVKAFEDNEQCIKWDVHGKVYNKIFRPYADKEISFLEIGLWMGESMKIWKEYFSKATFYAMDKMLPVGVNLLFIKTVYIGDQACADFMQRMSADIGKLDIVVDDGGHFPDEQQTSFNVLWPSVKKGGLYVIEDLHIAEKNMLDGYPCTIDFLEALDVRKEFYRGVDDFEKDICVLYKD